MAFWKNDDPPRPVSGIVPPRAPSGNQFRNWLQQCQQEQAAQIAARRADDERHSRTQEMLQAQQGPAIRQAGTYRAGELVSGGVDLTREMLNRIEALATEVRELRQAQEAGTVLTATANLADLTNPAIARANLGLSEPQTRRVMSYNGDPVDVPIHDNSQTPQYEAGIETPDLVQRGRVTSYITNPDGSESVTIENDRGELIHRDALPVTYFNDRCILFTLTDAQTSRMARHRDIPWQQIFDHIVESECSRAEQPDPRPSPMAGRAIQLRPRREVEADE